jgi:mannose-1-phosphate guanylyltransferase
LQALTWRLASDGRPKQFCRLLDEHTLLGATRARLTHLVASEQVLFAVNSSHRPFYREDLGDVVPYQLLEQSSNRGTGVAALYALGRLKRLDPEAIVGIFPSDHHCERVDTFREVVASAYTVARQDWTRIVLVGAAPDRPESDYGWIVRGAVNPRLTSAARLTVSDVKTFVEKPSDAVAESLMACGALWNTAMMVGKLRTFVRLFERATPRLSAAIAPLLRAIGRPAEASVATALYESVGAVDLSRDVLQQHPDQLSVIEAPPMGWTDLGRAERVLAVRNRSGIERSSQARLLRV